MLTENLRFFFLETPKMAKKSHFWHSTDWCLTLRKLFWSSAKLGQITK